MRRVSLLKRTLATVLAAGLLLQTGAAAYAREADAYALPDASIRDVTEEVHELDEDGSISEKMELEVSEEISEDILNEEDIVEPERYAPDDRLRVLIVFNENGGVVDEGYTVEEAVDDAGAVALAQEIEAAQDEMIGVIESEALNGEALDVQYSFTMLTDMVSADVNYEDIEKIEAIDGVEAVYIATQFHPLTATADDTWPGAASPRMTQANDMVGATTVWNNGYTGAGQRVGIIDTGLDTAHPSFAADPFNRHLQETATRNNRTVASYNLLTSNEISNVIGRMNLRTKRPSTTAAQLYLSTKVPFAFNYVDNNLTVTHRGDQQGDHGTHVAGIAAANYYVRNGNNYTRANQNVAGVAPDAQLLVFKVFGANGGAYTDDYMAAIEDALLLKADVVNLSLGADYGGYTRPDDNYSRTVMNKLKGTDMVAAMATGNAGRWSDESTYYPGRLRTADVNMHTSGEPATYTDALAVASVQRAAGNNPVAYTMSSFSSWGTPDDLSLKPEISAPGGNIYSTRYTSAAGSTYGNMSGTSMATPNIAGSTAVVMQYIKANNLKNVTGMDARALAQSLLMSTAVPMRGVANANTPEYSPRQQGAGIVNVNRALSTPAYILVGNKNGNDGKVKLELGDDRNKNGVYNMSFDVYNMTGRQLNYTVDASTLTMRASNGYIDGTTYRLNPTVTVTTNSQGGVGPVIPDPEPEPEPEPQPTESVYDINGDGSVNNTDAQLFMRHVIGTQTQAKVTNNTNSFDLDSNGRLDTTDVYRFLAGIRNGSIRTAASDLEDRILGQLTNRINTVAKGPQTTTRGYAAETRKTTAKSTDNGILFTPDESVTMAAASPRATNITVPANGKTTVNVRITLSNADRNYLNNNFAAGQFIEGFIYLDGTVQMSVPFMGFYGNFSDPSMFEPYRYNGNTRAYSGTTQTNYLTVRKNSNSTTQTIYGGNHYATDAEYNAARNAISRNATIVSFYYTLIRNGRETYGTITNASTGANLLTRSATSTIYAGYGFEHMAAFVTWNNNLQAYQWTNMNNYVNFNYPLSNVAAGTRINVNVISYPSYYASAAAAGGKGTTLSVPFTVDNSNAYAYNLRMQETGSGYKVSATVQDDNYVAAMILADADHNVLERMSPNQEVEGVATDMEMYSNVKPTYVYVYDYAGNYSVYEIEETRRRARLFGAEETLDADAVEETEATQETETLIVEETEAVTAEEVEPETEAEAVYVGEEVPVVEEVTDVAPVPVAVEEEEGR